MDRVTHDLTSLALRHALDGAAARQGVAAENLANLETPGYRPRLVDFESQLREALEAASDGDLADLQHVSPRRSIYAGPALRRDGNAVDLETEMSELVESGLQYQVLTRLLSRRLQMLRSVATEGGRL
ncbi:MAG: flagellar basal body rod protein FlgB [Armatimonadetes bacterium]|nr:flagellar basal body rod protein FlgB [Armatimonadota bacterium]